MEPKLCLPEEHRSVRSDCHGDFSGIEYLAYNFEPEPFGPLCAIFYRYWKEVNLEDLSGVVEREFAGEKIQCLEVELKLWQLQAERCKIQLAVKDDRIIGFLLYHLAYDCVLLVEGIYVLPDAKGHGVGKGLINSLGKPIKRLYFETRQENPPQETLSFLKRFESKELNQANGKTVWCMEWGS